MIGRCCAESLCVDLLLCHMSFVWVATGCVLDIELTALAHTVSQQSTDRTIHILADAFAGHVTHNSVHRTHSCVFCSSKPRHISRSLIASSADKSASSLPSSAASLDGAFTLSSFGWASPLLAPAQPHQIKAWQKISGFRFYC